MARPRSRSPRHKHRSYSSSYGSAPELQEGMPFVGPCGSESRDYRAQPGRPVRWRDPKGSGPAPGSHYEKSAARPMLPDERRAPAEPFHRPTPPWRVQSGSYHGYPPQPRHHSPGPYHSHRRLSPPRPAHPPPPPRRLSPSGPAHGPAPHRRPSPRGAFHGPNFNRTQRPSSPRHFHGPPGNRRPPSPAPLHGFVAHRRAHSPERDGGRWRPGPPADHQRSNCPDRAPRGRSRSPRAGRERPRAHSFDRSAREERWNGGLHLSPRHSRERRYSFSPPRVSEGFPGRISYTEKHLGRPAQPGYSAERELRKHSETTENRNAEWGEATHQYWSPKWKADPSSPRYHQERAGDARREVHRPLKCRGREGRSSSSSSSSSSCSANAQIGRSLKYPRGDMPDRFQKPKSFGSRETEGSSASSHSRDEAQLKGRKKRPVLVGGTKASPPQHREPEKVLKKHSKLPGKDVASLRLSVAKQKVVNKLRSTAALSKAPPPPQGKTTGKKNQRKPHHKLPLTGSSTTDEGAAQTETLTIKVDTRHSMTRYSSSAHSDRQLSRDLVTASRLASELQPRVKHVGPWRERALKNQTGDFDQDLITLVHQVKENYFRHDNLTLNERFSKLHYSKSFSQEDGRRYSGLKISRQIELPSPNHKEMKPVKKIGPTQSSFHSGSPNHRPAHLIKNSVVESPGHFRHFKKPLMGSLSLRLGVQQKPVFKKSLSIQSKYRNLQSLRQRGPHGRGAGSRRW
ncbi:BCLAF1 and THRAP3 family member 3 isoform X2 [Amia ocellicauda]|uniref:BCLAF1 and THRAP3 family member 3 isoform X2 n=1 Tax=Amia ocellicauda TaxID=2972642 RepID=UPI003463C992